MLESVPVFVAQAMIEHGLLDSIGAAAFSARSRIEQSLNDDPALWVVGVVAVLVVFFLFRRR